MYIRGNHVGRTKPPADCPHEYIAVPPRAPAGSSMKCAGRNYCFGREAAVYMENSTACRRSSTACNRRGPPRVERERRREGCRCDGSMRCRPERIGFEAIREVEDDDWEEQVEP